MRRTLSPSRTPSVVSGLLVILALGALLGITALPAGPSQAWAQKTEDLAEGQTADATPFFHGQRVGPILEATSLEEFLRPYPSDVVYGDPEAPLTIFEFSSFTCPHCARMHQEIMPTLIADYILMGQVKVVFRDFPLDQFAAGVGLVGQCIADQNAYYGFVGRVFSEQSIWIASDTPIAHILRIAAGVGLPEEEGLACLNNQAALDFLIDRRTLAVELVGVRATPTLMLTGEGLAPQALTTHDLPTIRQELDAALEAL